MFRTATLLVPSALYLLPSCKEHGSGFRVLSHCFVEIQMVLRQVRENGDVVINPPDPSEYEGIGRNPCDSS